jgi:L-asparaginase
MTNSSSESVLVIGTGGTIAGLRSQSGRGGYLAGQVSISALLAEIEIKFPIKNKQLCNIDSCDLTQALLSKIGQEVIESLRDPQFLGVVITHGTDTMEETGIFLELVLGNLSRKLGKKVVLTGAMLPSDDPKADGPSNLAQAINLAANREGGGGVWLAMAGKVMPAGLVSKVHTSRLDAFESDERLSLKVSEDLPIPSENAWPWVEIVMSHSGARDDILRQMINLGVEGIVLAGTGGGTVHADLAKALEQYTAKGGALLRASRIGRGTIPNQLTNGRIPNSVGAGPLNPAKARIALQLAINASRSLTAKPLTWQEIFARIAFLPNSG